MNTKIIASRLENRLWATAVLIVGMIPNFTDWKLGLRFAFTLVGVAAIGLCVDIRLGRPLGGNLKKMKRFYGAVGVITVVALWWGI